MALSATSLTTDIHSAGQIVGGVERPRRKLRAAVRQPTIGAWQELMTEWPYESLALAVNRRGVIVGRAAQSDDLDAARTRAAVWTPIPSVVCAH
jgi:hypothetical protein